MSKKMALINIRNAKENSGFTIVELLIVIVVIAILATISIVAYNGVQSRAKASAGQQTANSVVKKMEALNAVKGAYYSSTAALTGALMNTYANAAPVASEAVLDNTATLTAATATSNIASGLTATNANNGTTVSVYACATGANVWYWDYSAATPAQSTVIKAGQGC